MKEAEEFRFITIPKEDPAVRNMYDSLSKFTDKFSDNNELVDMIYDFQNAIDDLDEEVADGFTDDRLKECTKNINDFYQYIQTKDNLKKFLDLVKTMDDGEKDAENIIIGLQFLSNNQKLNANIKMPDNNDFEIIDDIPLFDDYSDEPEPIEEIKEEKKPQIDNEADRKESIYENLTTGSTDLNIPTEGSLAADEKTYGLLKNASFEDEAIAYSFAMDDMLDEMASDLLAFRNEFSNAQKNKEANFGSAAEGPKDYQEFTKSLNDCIDALLYRKNNDLTMGQIAEKYNKMLDQSKKYQTEHKPKYRSHRTPESAKRYEIMSRFNDKGIATVNAFNQMYNELKSDIAELGGNEASVKDIKCKEFKSTIISKFSGSKEFIDDYKQLAAIKNNIRDEKTIELMQNKILKNLKKLNHNFTGLKIDDYFKDKRDEYYKSNKVLLKNSVYSTWDYAQAYITRDYLDRISDDPSIDDLKKIYKETLDNDKFISKINDLSLNPTFKATVGLSKGDSLPIWSIVQKRVKESVEYYNDKFDEYIDKVVVGKYAHEKVNSRSVANLLLGLAVKNPSGQKSLELNAVFSSFKYDSYVKLAVNRGTNALIKYVENNKELMDKLKDKTQAEVKDVLKIIDNSKFINDAGKILYKASSKVLDEKLGIMQKEAKASEKKKQEKIKKQKMEEKKQAKRK